MQNYSMVHCLTACKLFSYFVCYFPNPKKTLLAYLKKLLCVCVCEKGGRVAVTRKRIKQQQAGTKCCLETTQEIVNLLNNRCSQQQQHQQYQEEE